MITIHTVKHTKIQERINKHGTKRKNNISLISFFTIFNNIKERKKKNKNGKKYWTYIRIWGRERHNNKKKKKNIGEQIENI